MDNIKPNGNGTCPHCGKGIQFLESQRGGVAIQVNGTVAWIAGKAPSGWITDPSLADQLMEIVACDCPLCTRPIIALQFYKKLRLDGRQVLWFSERRFIWPPSATRKPVASDIPVYIRSDYREAALVLGDSEKASAALSRRCLQSTLREAGRTKSKDLADQIEEVLPTLPAYLQQQLDAVRNIGNFAAHPQKSKLTGEIIDVEPGEAEWNLDVLDLLFDFYYEQPRIAKEKRDALNKKLAEVGKPPMR